jgi:DNA-binding transcriptional regulator PaaX
MRDNLNPILVEIAAGELIDKITILQIKREKIADATKLANICHELAVLNQAHEDFLPKSAGIIIATDELKQINEALWDIEDEIRDCERRQDFGPRFIELARSVYFSNDRRAAVKRQINDQAGSRLVEEKSYANYVAEDASLPADGT